MNPDQKRILIVATDAAGGIAKNGNMPWKLPEDMAHFKATTMGCPVIMGRKTFETIGRPLPGRVTVVVTKDRLYRNKNETSQWDLWIASGELILAESVAAAFDAVSNVGVVYLAGGLSVYEQGIKYCNEMIVTTIKKDFDCDLFFAPQLDKWHAQIWEHHRSESAQLDFMFTHFTRQAPAANIDDQFQEDSGEESNNDDESPDVLDGHPNE